MSPVFQMLTAVLASTGANMVELPNQVYTGRIIRKALEVLAKDVRQLGSTNLVGLLERLLLAEAQSTGIALSGISIPLQITIGDGGEDARITWTAGADRTDFLPRRFSSFQVKATAVSMASLQRECWEPTKLSDVRTLRAVFQSVLAAQGAHSFHACSSHATEDRTAAGRDQRSDPNGWCGPGTDRNRYLRCQRNSALGQHLPCSRLLGFGGRAGQELCMLPIIDDLEQARRFHCCTLG